MSPDPTGHLALGASALDHGRWAEAAEAFSAALADGAGPGAAEGLAQAAWWLDDGETSLTARESAYRGYRAQGDDVGAARTAVALGYDTILFGGGVAVGRGWIGRAAELLEGRLDAPEQGWLLVRRAELGLNVDHDAETALELAEQARRIGRSLGVDDLGFAAQALCGLARVRLGEIDAGMALLDAAASAATADDVRDLMWMGKICCWLITACQDTRDATRAAQWCRRVEQICERHDLAPLFSVCRTQYAAVLLAAGDVPGAERALADVLERSAGSRRVTRTDAVAELGELRRRQGRTAEAAALLAQSSAPRATAGLALLRLAQGEPELGRRLVDECLARVPASQAIERSDLLAAAVQLDVATGALDSARAGAEELTRAALALQTPASRGQRWAAAARLSHGEERIAAWTRAAHWWAEAGLVHDEAEARVELAHELAANGERDEARREARAALTLLEPLGTGPLIDRARALLGTGDRSPLTPRQREVLALLARGATNAEIGASLQLSEHTVHRHLANIYAALGVSSRVGATRYAIEHEHDHDREVR